MVTRFRVGTNSPTQRFNLHVSTISHIPKSYPIAFRDPNWYRAMLDEYTALIKNNTWILVPRPLDANIVRSMWLFRHKYNADGTLSPSGCLVSKIYAYAARVECGVNILLGNYLNCTYGDGKPITCCGYEGPLRGGFCSFCTSRNENSFAYDPKPNSFNNDQNFTDNPPQPRYETNICELCGNDAHFGYDCSPQVSFVYNQNPCFNQNFDNNFPQTSPSFPQTSPSFPQQYLCCENCGGPHATFQCQPMNQDFYETNSCGFDQFQPPQFLVNYPPQATNKEILRIQAFLKEYDHIPPNEKCMALLLAEEIFLKIKQTMEEEQNQPKVMQELLLKLMNDLHILKGIQQEKKEMTT
ncbi:reverse transcriptase domain-containing protein [Tanacetum coccineum]